MEPAILKRLVSQLRAKGHSLVDAHKIAVAALQKSGNLDENGKVTKKGLERGKMTPAERAKDRASKDSGRPVSDYKYNPRTNRAVLKNKN